MANGPVNRKRRTREHIIADLSVNHVERFALLAGFTVLRVHHDYGIDLHVATFNSRGEVEPGLIYFQLKATDHLMRMRKGRNVVLPLDQRDVQAWLDEKHPVILVIFDAVAEISYWIHVQESLSSNWTTKGAQFTAYRSIRIPVGNRLGVASMVKFADEKNKIYGKPEGSSSWQRNE